MIIKLDVEVLWVLFMIVVMLVCLIRVDKLIYFDVMIMWFGEYEGFFVGFLE